MSTYSPMIQQYLDVKSQNPDALLMFRLGDFYELFFEDAKIASRELQITLTGREGGVEERIPMAGVPHHAIEGYLGRLVQKGYKVAICEQMEDPALSKGIVRRELIRIVTPGTAIEPNLLVEQKNNYIAAIYPHAKGIGFAYADISTGEFSATQMDALSPDGLNHELQRISPSEILFLSGSEPSFNADAWRLTFRTEEFFDGQRAKALILKHFKLSTLESFGLDATPPTVSAAGAILRYLGETFISSPMQFERITTYSVGRYMALDAATRRNLELTGALRNETDKTSLLSILDKTATPMGARLIRQWLLSPLLDLEEIGRRQEVIGELLIDLSWREGWLQILAEIRDLERLTSRIVNQSANARELRALGESLQYLPAVASLARRGRSPLFYHLTQVPSGLIELSEEILRTVTLSPSLALKEGGLIQDGVDSELDELRELSRGGKDWILAQEQRERERTGIKSLKIGFNRAFGYYIEVTRANQSSVPQDYIRKQTLVNAERYITPELKEKESAILNAQQRLSQLEYEIFSRLRHKAAGLSGQIRTAASYLAQVDVLLSLARVASAQRYVCPTVNHSDAILIRQGRHPVVEQLLPSGSFVANDLELDGDRQMMILTGPNMAGKSTYMRQIALTVIMAQMGSYVPAEKAEIGLVDRIFTRVGAVDDLASGQSTFMVEMVETANILHNATPRSLILLDEVGRGTSTFDGVSIAWAISEYIAGVVRAKTLFATHYHELTELSKEYPHVHSHQMEVVRTQEGILFLRKVIPGGASHSYGIEVAKLAGLPTQVIERAYGLLREIERKSRLGASLKQQLSLREKDSDQISFF